MSKTRAPTSESGLGLDSRLESFFAVLRIGREWAQAQLDSDSEPIPVESIEMKV